MVPPAKNPGTRVSIPRRRCREGAEGLVGRTRCRACGERCDDQRRRDNDARSGVEGHPETLEHTRTIRHQQNNQVDRFRGASRSPGADMPAPSPGSARASADGRTRSLPQPSRGDPGPGQIAVGYRRRGWCSLRSQRCSSYRPSCCSSWFSLRHRSRSCNRHLPALLPQPRSAPGIARSEWIALAFG